MLGFELAAVKALPTAPLHSTQPVFLSGFT